MTSGASSVNIVSVSKRRRLFIAADGRHSWFSLVYDSTPLQESLREQDSIQLYALVNLKPK